jgi:hypothetical protein
MEAVSTFETSVNFNETTRHNIPEGRRLFFLLRLPVIFFNAAKLLLQTGSHINSSV